MKDEGERVRTEERRENRERGLKEERENKEGQGGRLMITNYIKKGFR